MENHPPTKWKSIIWVLSTVFAFNNCTWIYKYLSNWNLFFYQTICSRVYINTPPFSNRHPKVFLPLPSPRQKFAQGEGKGIFSGTDWTTFSGKVVFLVESGLHCQVCSDNHSLTGFCLCQSFYLWAEDIITAQMWQQSERRFQLHNSRLTLEWYKLEMLHSLACS